MATLQSIQMTVPRHPVSGPGIGGRNIHCQRGQYVGNAAAADVIELMRLHPRFRVTGILVKASGAAITAAVGDADDIDRYFASAAVADGATSVALAGTGADYQTTRYTTVTATVGGAGFTGGTLTVLLFGYIEEPA
jgi:hypothetical protein